MASTPIRPDPPSCADRDHRSRPGRYHSSLASRATNNVRRTHVLNTDCGGPATTLARCAPKTIAFGGRARNGSDRLPVLRALTRFRQGLSSGAG